MDFITNVFNKIDDFMYFPILVIVLAAAGLYFTIRTKGGDAKKVVVKKYILNGQPLKQTYITHDQIMAGGTLEVVF